MGDRINELEQSINDLKVEIGMEGFPSPLAPPKQKYEDPHHGEGKSIENDTSRQVTFSKRRNGLLKKAFELSVSSSLLEASSLNLQALGLVSTFRASYVTRNKGRRASILVGTVSFFLGGASNAGAVNITMLIIGRILLGAGI
ncbi:hypothetical protein GOBAR_DD17728 [Gossypium barbadense]|nr:hypothetical protein GOBAR_DD17728 [Gossypium barbadense]